MKKHILIPLLLFIAPFYINAQYNVNLERINTLAKDSTYTDFYFEKLKNTFKTNPQDLSLYQLQILYYQPLNEKGSLRYNLETYEAYLNFKKLKFNSFITKAEESLEEMPTNLTLLFLLSLAYGDSKTEFAKSAMYSKKFKLVLDHLMINRSLLNEEYPLELNCETDIQIVLNILGLDTSQMKHTYKLIEGGHTLNTYEINGEKVHFKTLMAIKL